MEITSQGSINVSKGGAYKLLDESECVTNQPMANGMLPNHTEESPPCSDRLEKGDSGDEGLMDNTFPDDDISRLLPDCTPLSRPSKNKDSISEDRVLPPAVCTPPSPSIPLSLHPLPLSPSIRPDGSSSSSPPLQSTPCHRHLPHHNLHRPRANQKRLSSGAKSHASLKTDSAHHIKEVARDDCCAHCVLACLFCEVLSMCSVLGDCLACGGSGMVCCCDAAGCCCCCAEAMGGMACTEEACQAVLDCGMMEDCCGSSDCLEICLECCSICFPS